MPLTDGTLAKALLRESILQSYIGKEVTLLMPGGVVYAGKLLEPMETEVLVESQPLHAWMVRVERQVVGQNTQKATIMPQLTLEFTAFDDIIVSVYEESQEEALEKLKAEQQAKQSAIVTPGRN
jgi:hypothetical protein